MVVNTFPTAFRLKAKMIAIDEKRFFTEFAVKYISLQDGEESWKQAPAYCRQGLSC